MIKKLAIESKHSSNEVEWYTDLPKGVKEVSSHHLEAQIFEMTKVVLVLTKEKGVAKKQYGTFLKIEHPTNMCSLLQEDIAPMKAFDGYQQH